MSHPHRLPSCSLAGATALLVWLLASAAPLAAQFGSQQRTQKVSELEGGFGGDLADLDLFASAIAPIGDVDGDGNEDLAVLSRDVAGGPGARALWVLLLETDGTVRAEARTALPAGGPPAEQGDVPSTGLASLGDLDGDGVVDLAVGDPQADDGGPERGAVLLVFLNPDGSAKAAATISDTQGGLSAALDDGDGFGSSLAASVSPVPGAVIDLLVGAVGDDDGGLDKGAVWILSLALGGTIVAERKVSQTAGGFGGTLADGDAFGASLAVLGDVDGNGAPDLAVGAELDDEGGADAGAVWILLLDGTGALAGERRIAAASGGFAGPLEARDNFGSGVAPLGDLDGDGTPDLAVGAPGDDDGGSNRGAVWLLFLEPDGGVSDALKLGELDPGFAGTLADGDFFGSSVALLVDLDRNGLPELVAGAPGDDDGGPDHGALYVVFPQFPAEIVSNGSGINPIALMPGLQPPRIGTSWDPILEDSALPLVGGISFNVIGVSSRPLSASEVVSGLGPNVVGELLIDLSFLQLTQQVPPGERFSLPIPANVALIGLDCFSQSVAVRGSTLILTNRLDVIIGFPPAALGAPGGGGSASRVAGGLDPRQ